MKKIICLIMILSLVFCLVACNGGDQTENNNGDKNEKTISTVARVLNSFEYTLYMNIFYSEQASDYLNKTYTKEGTLAVLHDSFNGKDRYYVWGYADETLCCDWQWEFVPSDPTSLPPIGSQVKVTGTFVESADALDGYHFDSATVETVAVYKDAIGKHDTTTMSPTLTRVQIINMYNFPADYNGQTFKIYGRAMVNGIQHPYYDGAWELPVEYNGTLPATGAWMTVTGVFSGTAIENCKLVVDTVVPD